MEVSARRRVAAAPDEVLSRLTDLAALPAWNAAIQRVVVAPDVLTPGAVWKVEMAALGRHWISRSELVELDRTSRRFAYRSQTDDGNPSYAEWLWIVTEAPGGSDVEVRATLNPRTFWRRALLGRIRRRQLERTELPGSLAALATAVETVTPGA